MGAEPAVWWAARRRGGRRRQRQVRERLPACDVQPDRGRWRPRAWRACSRCATRPADRTRGAVGRAPCCVRAPRSPARRSSGGRRRRRPRRASRAARPALSLDREARTVAPSVAVARTPRRATWVMAARVTWWRMWVTSVRRAVRGVHQAIKIPRPSTLEVAAPHRDLRSERRSRDRNTSDVATEREAR